MRAEIANLADSIKEGLVLLRRHLDWDRALLRLDELNSLSEDPKLWDDPEKAQAIMGERNRLAAAIDRQKALEQGLEDATALAELAEEEGDEGTVTEVQRDLERLKEQVDRLQLESLLSGEADANDAFLQVAAGAGGTESQDWAQMLLRMYLRWAEQHGYKVEWIEESEGEEAGIKSATIKIIGENAYGWLKTESGVHRLVRISPFDSNARRHTSFASVSVSPVIDDRIQIDIQDKDLKIDTYRASGAGGQHVNRTDSAVRITHLPTGIVVACQNDRSQHRNRAQAMDMLRAKLYELEMQKRRAASDALEAQKMDTSFGSQIRNYVLHPYKLVKDLRTGVESGNPQAVLDGDLDRFLEASLAQGAGQRRPDA
ncbi:peptide chain release factor 2 [Benzoatithermus flavus]|uniref:Peptide chain release factor 2 n=1 Tax=Benzoatithermus flavus TaxID=3108223 RepID=A0ABU8XL78_9PROT